MSLFIGASQEEAFRSVMDYFTSRRMRILTSNSPSYIRAELGAWVSMFMGNAKGEVEATIVKRDSGSYINLHFSFLKEYLADLILSVVATFLLYVIPFVVTLGYPSEVVQMAQGWLYMIVTLMAILLFGFALGTLDTTPQKHVINPCKSSTCSYNHWLPKKPEKIDI